MHPAACRSNLQNTSLEHIVNDAAEGVVLESSRHSLLVGKLLVDLVVLGMGPLLHADVDAVIGWKGLFEPDTHSKADDSGQGTVVDGWRELDQDVGETSRIVPRRRQVDIG
jgi:hypothetical protein